jgi:3-deoxy-D-manno-octulosonate 8-phosphate phosphatase KdsC-like HAD superfamily phosphatase
LANVTFKRTPIYRPWSSSDDEALKRLASLGATVLRATAAMGRGSQTIKKRARELGVELVGMREAKRRVRAIAEQEANDDRFITIPDASMQTRDT